MYNLLIVEEIEAKTAEFETQKEVYSKKCYKKLN